MMEEEDERIQARWAQDELQTLCTSRVNLAVVSGTAARGSESQSLVIDLVESSQECEEGVEEVENGENGVRNEGHTDEHEPNEDWGEWDYDEEPEEDLGVSWRIANRGQLPS